MLENRHQYGVKIIFCKMKAWNDLNDVLKVHIYWTGDRDQPKSRWYMDHGVKIERLANGTFEINNAMYPGDFYKPITEAQMFVFEHVGWLAGCYRVCIDTFNERMDTIDALLNRYPEDPVTISRKNTLQKKIDRYYELADKLVF